MFKNQNTAIETPGLSSLILMSALGCGMIVSPMHGAFLDKRYRNDIASIELSSRIARDLHTHSSINLQPNRVIIDPKSLRSIRSEGDKQAENDGMRGNWDVYMS